MTERMTDEMLMAFVDGELDAETAADIRRALQADAALAQRAAAFRAARDMAREAYADLMAEPAPPSLVAGVLERRPAPGEARPAEVQSNVVAFPRRRLMQAALPLAASLALVFGLAGYFIGQRSLPEPAGLFGSGVVAQALGETPSGQTRAVHVGGREARLATLAAYRVEDGLCRSFTMTGGEAGSGIRGVGCRRGGAWHVDLAVAHRDDAYAPASAGALGSLDAYLDALDAEGPLDAEDEAAAAR